MADPVVPVRIPDSKFKISDPQMQGADFNLESAIEEYEGDG